MNLLFLFLKIKIKNTPKAYTINMQYLINEEADGGVKESLVKMFQDSKSEILKYVNPDFKVLIAMIIDKIDERIKRDRMISQLKSVRRTGGISSVASLLA